MGTSLSSTCTSRMVLSIWERLAGSRLQGTHRWITCRGQQRRQLYERKQPIKFMKLLFQVGHRRCCEQKKIGQEIQTRQKRSESERVFFVWADKHQKKIIFTYPKVQNKQSSGKPIYTDVLTAGDKDLHVLPCPLRGSSPSSRSVLPLVSSFRQATAAPSASISWCSPAHDWRPQSERHHRSTRTEFTSGRDSRRGRYSKRWLTCNYIFKINY